MERGAYIVNLFKKGDRGQGITLLDVVGKVYCKVLNNKMVWRSTA